VSATNRLPPALNIIALATFAASLSARALDPVLPHVADDFGVTITAAAGFAAVFAFTFAIIQPVLGATADLFGKARLMILCLVLLGLANILGAMATSFPLLFATRILAGIGSGGVFPIALGLTSDLVGPEKRQIAIGRTLMGSMSGNLLGASFSGLIGDFMGWRGVLAILGALVVVAAIAVAAGFRGKDLQHPPRTNLSALKHGYRTIFTNPNARICYSAVFIEGCCVLGLFPFIAAFLFELGETSLSIAGVVIAGFAVGGLFYTMTVSRLLPRIGVKGLMHVGCDAGRAATGGGRDGPAMEAASAEPAVHGLGILHDPRLPAGVCQRALRGSARHSAVAAFVFLFHGADAWPHRLRLRHPACRQGPDPAHRGRDNGRAWNRLRAAVAAETAGRRAPELAAGRPECVVRRPLKKCQDVFDKKDRCSIDDAADCHQRNRKPHPQRCRFPGHDACPHRAPPLGGADFLPAGWTMAQVGRVLSGNGRLASG